MFKKHEQSAVSQETKRGFAPTENSLNDRGVTLIETMFAVALCLIGVFGVGNVIYVATATSKNQGTETTRATIYAQDKIEKLLSLGSVPVSGVTTASFSHCTQPAATQLASYADCNTTGITSGGWATGLLAGGAISPLPTSCGSATAGYTDYLDASGTQLTGGSCSSATVNRFSYVRLWQISDLNTFGSTPALKQITVAVYSLSAVNTAISASTTVTPLAVLTSYVSDPN
jgi:Tfp pilus assembly protein PilV